jgi:hypothetical protein
MSGEEDNGHRALLRNELGRRQPIEHGHIQVGNDQVNVFMQGALDQRLPVGCVTNNLMTKLAQPQERFLLKL